MLDALEGFTVGVTADRRAGEQAELLERRGALVSLAPAIRTMAISEEDATRQATLSLFDRPPDHVVANTAIGIRGWVGAAEAWGLDEQLLSTLRSSAIIARGPKAAGAVTALGVPVAWRAPSERLSEVIDHLLALPIAGTRIAFQQHGDDCAAITRPLRDAGADVVEVPVYRWTLPPDLAPLVRLLRAVDERRVDCLTFTSVRTVENVFAVADTNGIDLVAALDAGDVVAVAVGPVTAEALRAHGVASVVAPEVGRLGTMVRVMTDALAAKRVVLHGEVIVQGVAVAGRDHRAVLTDKERALLRALTSAAGTVLSRERLLDLAWPDGTGEDRSLEAAIHRLRRKLGPGAGALTTVSKRGYRIDLTASRASA